MNGVGWMNEGGEEARVMLEVATHGPAGWESAPVVVSQEARATVCIPMNCLSEHQREL
jgi:hypothetical protein